MTIDEILKAFLEGAPAGGIAIFAIWVLRNAYREWLRDIHQVRQDYREDNKQLVQTMMDASEQFGRLASRIESHSREQR